MEVTMLNLNTFLKGFYMFIENFEFTNSELYTEMVYGVLKDKLTDKRFLDTCNNLLKETTKETWNKTYGFKGRPAVKDWVDAFIPKAIEKTRYVKCPITGANLKEIYFDYPDYYLEFLNQKKQGKIEDSGGQNKKHNQVYLEELKTSIIKKI